MTELTAAEKRIKTALADFINLKHPVALVIEPLRVSAVERAKTEAQNIVSRVRKELAEAGNDLEKVAPYPNSSASGFHVKLAKYRLFTRLCKSRQGSRRPSDPNPADVNPIYVAKYVKDAQEAAANQYDAFIVKLCQKIGACRSATITGEHIWGRSYLRVEDTSRATVEVWMTQQIVNCSKLGLLFNQWPSRQVKS